MSTLKTWFTLFALGWVCLKPIVAISYADALDKAKNHIVDLDVVHALSQEHQEATEVGSLNRLRNIKINLAAALLIYSNNLSTSLQTAVKMCKHSIRLLSEAVELDVSDSVPVKVVRTTSIFIFENSHNFALTCLNCSRRTSLLNSTCEKPKICSCF
jgi:hypothetical protein